MYIYADNSQSGEMRYASLESGIFPSVPHVHRDLELIHMQEGCMDVAVDGKHCHMQAGECLLVLPHQIHAYSRDSHARGIVLNFSGEMVSTFMTIVGASVAEEPVFQPDEVCHILLRQFLQSPQNQAACDKKCLLYALCSCFLKNARLLPRCLPEHSPAYHAIHYVAEHYRENISLKDIARALGYDYHYLSRSFHQTTQIGFRDFLNFHRIEYARSLLRNTQMSVSDIAEACGFQTLRSFHRVFQDVIGLSPTQFRNAEQET